MTKNQNSSDEKEDQEQLDFWSNPKIANWERGIYWMVIFCLIFLFFFCFFKNHGVSYVGNFIILPR